MYSLAGRRATFERWVGEIDRSAALGMVNRVERALRLRWPG
jgi:hypothetical protein